MLHTCTDVCLIARPLPIVYCPFKGFPREVRARLSKKPLAARSVRAAIAIHTFYRKGVIPLLVC